MFSQASVILFTGCVWQTPSPVRPPWADTPRADTPQADTPPGKKPPMPSACWDTYRPCPVHVGIHTPPCPVHAEIHTPLPSACWDTLPALYYRRTYHMTEN